MRSLVRMTCVGLGALLVHTSSWAQPPDSLWSRFYGTSDREFAYSVCATADGGYAIGGITYSGGVDAWLIRTDQNGDSLWSRRYGSPGNQYCYSIDTTSDGGYILCGYSEPYNVGPRNLWMVRMSSGGSELWSQCFGDSGENGDGAWSAHELPDGGFFVAGGHREHAGFWFIRTDAHGDSLWSRAYGEPDPWGCYEALPTRDGGFIMAGSAFHLIRLNAMGDSLWSRTYGDNPIFDRCMAVRQTRDGGFVLTGYMCDMERRLAVVRADSEGDTLWVRSYRMGGFDGGWDICETPDGGFAIAGSTTIEGWDRGFAAILLRVNADGDSLWSMTYDGPGDDTFMSICQSDNASFVLTGWSARGGVDNTDIWLFRTGPELSAIRPPVARPWSFALSVHPNPFNLATAIGYNLPNAEYRSLYVFDVLGRRVRVLADGFAASGNHRVVFDGSDLPSGVYVCHLQTSEHAESCKMVLLK